MIAPMHISAVLALLPQLVSSHGGPSALAATPAPVFPVTSGGGLPWAVPNTRGPGPSSAMRLATYFLPASAGDAERPELAVFWFGPGKGGSVDANVERWFSQFASSPRSEEHTSELQSLRHLVCRLLLEKK